jgi:hypothetical protein
MSGGAAARVWVRGYPRSNRAWVARAALGLLAHIRSRVEADLKMSIPDKECRLLLIHPTSSDPLCRASRTICRNAAGLYLPVFRTLLVQRDVLDLRDRAVLVHEATHLYCHTASGSLKNHFWSYEGYATHLADLESSNPNEALRAAATRYMVERRIRKPATLQELLRLSARRRLTADLALYTSAALLVAFLRDAGARDPACWELVRAALLRAREFGDPIGRFERAFGVPIDVIEETFGTWCEHSDMPAG